MISNEMRRALAAVDQLDAALDRISVLPLHTLKTQQKVALLVRLEALRLVLSSLRP